MDQGNATRFPGTTWAADASADRLDDLHEQAVSGIHPSFAGLVTLLDQAQANLLIVQRHTSDPESARWLDAALSDALSEAEALYDRAIQDAVEAA